MILVVKFFIFLGRFSGSMNYNIVFVIIFYHFVRKSKKETKWTKDAKQKKKKHQTNHLKSLSKIYSPLFGESFE
jgi:hypothetical protein